MTRMRERIGKLLALSSAQRRILLKAAFMLPCFWIGLHLLGLHRLRAWLMPVSVFESTPLSIEAVKDMGNLVNIAGRHAPCPVTCLTRSLLLDWMLLRRGVASQFRIGVRLAQGVLEAHAWVEVAGVPVNDRSDIADQFAPFADIPPPGFFRSS